GSVEAPQAADEVVAKVLEIVAEKTGYPKDMLDLELDLEADLGIDTVKQAEMFASVRAAFGIPRDENLKLRDFPTLAHVIQFARDRRDSPAPEVAVAEATAEAVSGRPAQASFAATDRIPRRVPVPVVRPPLSACKPTGVAIGPGSRVLVAADQGGVGDALAARLREMGAEVLSLADGAEKWLAGDGVQGVYWLPALDDEGNLEEMDPARWREAVDVRVKSLYETMRTLYDRVEKPGTFLVSATRLGGQHGYGAAGATAPLGGSVTGFTKAYKRERPEALVKAVDFEPGRDSAEIAGILVEETLRDPGAVETGHRNGARWTVGMREMSASDGTPGLTLTKETVFLITGAAGSIVSAITADLAAASGGTFHLLDLTPEPDPADPDLGRFSTDRDGLKQDLAARLKARGKRATPVMVERELAAIERAQAAQTAIDAVRAAGGTPFYYAVNLTDPETVRKVIDAVRERSGRIDVLLHAAGIERSRFLRDKDRREFDLVFDVKCDGWYNLMRAIGEMPVAATVAFSSIAGRFGNGAQTDYSSANDLLCKLSSSLRRTRTQTRGIAVDWTAWSAIGMAARGSIPKMMELAGIDMLPPEAGIPFIRRELTAGGTRGEVIAAQRLGAMTKEFDPAGGLGSLEGLGPVAGRVESARLFEGLLVETMLDPATQPFLYDHQIDGTPVLPGVMGVEAFAEAASSLLPGWRVEAIEDISFLAPFKFYRGEPRAVIVEAKLFAHGDGVSAECRLMGRRHLAGQSEPQETTHFTARVLLSPNPPEWRLTQPPRPTGNSVVEAASIYRVFFHGPAYQVVERVWHDGLRVIGEMAAQLPPNHLPAERATVMAPRLIELCLQTAGIWEVGLDGRMGLPRRIGRVSVIAETEQSEGRLYAVVTPNPGEGTFDAEVVDSAGNVHLHLSGYSTIALDTKVEAGPFRALHTATA
ncbi:MAG TPA: SDR family NAD(P)-dependent oxidoreductase, partial [Bryobacteraceae bacterium]|nr:SDR family NAD(P)-dependent oxidoreductase [Bryobacteraceae bacterium]